jgi:hypothetical protein
MEDDDFDDIEDIELNDDILKALQDTEDRYTLTAASQTPASNPNPVASKPPFTFSTKPPTVSRRIYTHPDDTPDISIAHDGSYAVQPSTPQLSHPSSRNARATLPSQYPPRLRLIPSPSTRPIKPLGPTTARPASSSSNTARARVDTVGMCASRFVIHLLQITDGDRILGSENMSHKSALPLEPMNGKHGPDVERLMTQLQQVNVSRKRFSPVSVLTRLGCKLQAEREAMEKQLEEARNAQFMREGEIATLRRTMEKVSPGPFFLDAFLCAESSLFQQSVGQSETLNKLRAEKLDAEQRRAAVEVEMAAEIDRLKTRFSFKVLVLRCPSNADKWLSIFELSNKSTRQPL